jgi:hypothetical protein
MIPLVEIKKQIVELQNLDDFFGVCNADADASTPTWAFSSLDQEKSFDIFMQQLLVADRRAAIQFAASFANVAFDYVHEDYFDESREFGFALLKSDRCRDGDSIEKQLRNVEKWLKTPTPKNLELVRKGIDPSRQMDIWEEDLFPEEDQMWVWIIENTQLLSMAVVAGDAEDDDQDPEESPYSWSAKACVARSALCSLKTIA